MPKTIRTLEMMSLLSHAFFSLCFQSNRSQLGRILALLSHSVPVARWRIIWHKVEQQKRGKKKNLNKLVDLLLLENDCCPALAIQTAENSCDFEGNTTSDTHLVYWKTHLIRVARKASHKQGRKSHLTNANVDLSGQMLNQCNSLVEQEHWTCKWRCNRCSCFMKLLIFPHTGTNKTRL